MVEVVLICMAIGWAAQALGGAVAHGAAGIRGKPSPTVQKWDAKERARRAAGHAPRQRPKSVFATAWQNATEKHLLKAEQKHHGRMSALREMGPNVSAEAKKKALRQAEFRAELARKSAQWVGAGRDRAVRIAGDLRQVIDEKRASRAAVRDTDDEQPSNEQRRQQAADAVADLDQAATDETTNVVPINRQRGDNTRPADVDPDQTPGNDADNTENGSTETGGTSTMANTNSTQAHSGEINGLGDAIDYTGVFRNQVGNLVNALQEILTAVDDNAHGFSEQSETIEDAKTTMADLGFKDGTTIQESLSTVSESVPEAAEALKRLADDLPGVLEQLTAAQTALDTAYTALNDQVGIGEQVDVNANAGVAEKTDFYANA